MIGYCSSETCPISNILSGHWICVIWVAIDFIALWLERKWVLSFLFLALLFILDSFCFSKQLFVYLVCQDLIAASFLIRCNTSILLPHDFLWHTFAQPCKVFISVSIQRRVFCWCITTLSVINDSGCALEAVEVPVERTDGLHQMDKCVSLWFCASLKLFQLAILLYFGSPRCSHIQ